MLGNIARNNAVTDEGYEQPLPAPLNINTTLAEWDSQTNRNMWITMPIGGR